MRAVYSLKNIVSFFVVAVLATLPSVAVQASGAGPEPFMPVQGSTTQPIGHYEFCGRHPGECSAQTSANQRVTLNQALWNQLVAVNELVTKAIQPATDMTVWGHEEWWEYPTTMGDCDDMMLLKRRDLMRMGWPVGALLMTVVRQSNGEGHAVLTVLTNRGDFVLDSLDPRIELWSATDYQFVKRQSQFDAGRWVAIADDHLQLVGSIKR